MTTSGAEGEPAGARVALHKNTNAGARHGWAFTPLKGKRPFVDGWQKAQAAPPQQVREWIERGFNIGLRTGRVSGVVVVDVDEGGRVPSWCQALKPPTVVTGSGGLHFYFRAPQQGLKNSAGKIGAKIDVRGDGGQVVFPGSTHPKTGHQYAWATGASIDDRALPDMPRRVVDLLNGKQTAQTQRTRETLSVDVHGSTPYGMRAVHNEIARLQAAPEGQRNDTLNRVAFSLGTLADTGHLGTAYDWVMDTLESVAIACGLTQRESKATIRSGFAEGVSRGRPNAPALPGQEPRPTREPSGAQPPEASAAGAARANVTGALAAQGQGGPVLPPPQHAQPTPASVGADREPYTDLGNARRLARQYGNSLRWSEGLGWMTWNKRVWERDGAVGAHARVFELTDIMRIEAEDLGTIDAEAGEAYYAWAMRSQNKPRLDAAVKLAQFVPPITAQTEQFDTNPMLVTCNNGTMNLDAWRMYEPRRADHITKQVHVDFRADSTCPRWLAFLDRIFAGDAELIAFVQRALGYSLTGHTGEQVLFLCYGTGANGKSTLLSTARYVFGDYAANADFSTFLVGRNQQTGGGARSDLARLAGSRFVCAVEPDDGARFSESVVKAITGGDPITARYQYASEFEYTPQLKLWLSANHKPRITGTDEAIWRRIRLIPFTVTIPKDERDRDLEAKLREEAPGILQWILQGCFSWKQNGLAAPKVVTDATQEYREEQDSLAEWIAQECHVGNTQFRCQAMSLYANYKAWAEQNGEYVWSQTRFGRALKERGIDKSRDGATRRTIYIGIALRGSA